MFVCIGVFMHVRVHLHVCCVCVGLFDSNYSNLRRRRTASSCGRSNCVVSDMAYVYTYTYICKVPTQSVGRRRETSSYDSRLVLFAPSRVGGDVWCEISLEQLAMLSLSVVL